MARWILEENDANIDLMSKTLKLNPIICNILANRGIRSKHAAIKFLNPRTSFMHDIKTCADVTKAGEIIQNAISQGKSFCIYGDYDVDGVSSTYILYKSLKNLGANCSYYIPHREDEGYGLNIPAVEELAKKSDILIAVDNGIASIAEVDKAIELGLKVIIIDHHKPQSLNEDSNEEALPKAHAIINPKRADCPYPFKELCAAGITYKFCEYLHELFNAEFIGQVEFLAFASIATFCDVVDLIDENRIIAANGIKIIQNKKFNNIGLNALVKERDLEYNNINTFEIGFILGPCINATGRLESACIALELFLSKTQDEALPLAAKLIELNEKRKSLTSDFAESAIAELKSSNDKVLVLHKPNMHESIAGIVAGRIKDNLGKPAIVFTNAKEEDMAKGSARSIEAYDIFEQMQKHKELFTRFGGHKMAAGASLITKNIAILHNKLNADCSLTDEDFIPIIYAQAQLDLDDITYNLAQDIEIIAPFGKGNKKPVFITRQIYSQSVEIIGQSKSTMRLTFRSNSGRKLTGVAFKSVDSFVDKLATKYSNEVCEGFINGRMKNLTILMDIAYNIDINVYNGNSSLQLRILDFDF